MAQSPLMSVSWGWGPTWLLFSHMPCLRHSLAPPCPRVNIKIPKILIQAASNLFLSPWSASVVLVPCPNPQPHPSSRYVDFHNCFLRSLHTCALCLELLLARSPAKAHPSFAPSWNSKDSLRSPREIFFLLHRGRGCSLKRGDKWISQRQCQSWVPNPGFLVTDWRCL